MTAPLLIAIVLAVFLILSLVVGAVIERYAPIRDEDEELLHPLGRTRLP